MVSTVLQSPSLRAFFSGKMMITEGLFLQARSRQASEPFRAMFILFCVPLDTCNSISNSIKFCPKKFSASGVLTVSIRFDYISDGLRNIGSVFLPCGISPSVWICVTSSSGFVRMGPYRPSRSEVSYVRSAVLRHYQRRRRCLISHFSSFGKSSRCRLGYRAVFHTIDCIFCLALNVDFSV